MLAVLLAQITLLSLFVFMLRLVYIEQVPRLLCTFFSTAVVILSYAQVWIKKNAQAPESQIRGQLDIKLAQLCCIMLLFSMNGNNNDYFILYFFFCTSFLGVIYMFYTGYKLPKTKYQNFDSKKERTESEYVDIIKLIKLNQFKSTADWFVLLGSLVFFFGGLITFCHSREVFAGGEQVSTMGATAVILVLINM